MIQYIIESAFCLVCCYGFYWLALRREMFFQWNRFYLLLAPLLSLLLPALKIQLEVLRSEVKEAPVAAFDLPAVVEQVQTAPLAFRRALDRPISNVWSVSLGDALWWLYLSGAGLLALRLSLGMWQLYRLLRCCRKSLAQGAEVAVSDAVSLPLASFFGYIFWNKECQLSENQKFLLEHELVHVRQRHSLDVLLMEAMVVVQWFNPLMHAFRRSLCAVHEYIADDYVVRQTQQRYEYASLLVRHRKVAPKTGPALINTFGSLIQHRLAMLAKRPSRSIFRAKYLLSLPLFGALMLLFSFRLIEKMPAAVPLRNAVQVLENYANTLSTVTVFAKKKVSAEPTPYNFYWGSIQCKIYHNPVADTYFSEASVSPEEFRECLKREPRIWNGQTLEQYVSFNVGSLAVRSDYNDESVYVARRKALEDFAASLEKGDFIELGKVYLPNGKTAILRLSFDAEAAKWLPRNSGEINWLNNPAKLPSGNPIGAELRWGGIPVSAGGRQFFTVGEFWEIVQREPEMVFPGGRTQRADSLSVLATIPGQGFPLLLPPAEGRYRFTIAELRPKLESIREKIRPGVVIRITERPGSAQPLYSFMADAGQSAESYFSLVPDNDPRLPLLRSDRRDFVFEWGNFSRKFLLMYGRAYSGSGENLHADTRYIVESPLLNAKEIAQMLRLTPRLYRGEEPLDVFSFSVKYLDREVKVENGRVPADFLTYFEQNAKDHEILIISNFQANTGAARRIITQGTDVSSGLPADWIGSLTVNSWKGEKLICMGVRAPYFEAAKARIKAVPGVWFQEGDINLSNISIRLDVKPAESKPPLPVSEYMLQWGHFTQGLGSRTAPGTAADTLIFPLYSIADLKAITAAKPQILRNEKPASRVQFRLRCGNLNTVVTETGISRDIATKLGKRLDAAEWLWLSDFQADGIAPRPVVMLFYPKDIFAGRAVGEPQQTKPFYFSVSPNPARDRVNLSFDLPQAGKGRLSVVNSIGQVVYTLETDFQAGKGTYPLFAARDLKSKGVFFAVLEMPYGKVKQQFVVE